MHYPRISIALVAAVLALPGCAVNPVTGKTELSLVSTAQEIEIGNENYPYMQQSGGGEYDVDAELTTYVQGIGNRLAAISSRSIAGASRWAAIAARDSRTIFVGTRAGWPLRMRSWLSESPRFAPIMGAASLRRPKRGVS